MKSRDDLTTTIGWNVEKMAREGKKMKPLAEYLKPRREPSPDEGAAGLRGMIARIKAKQEERDGSR